MASHSFVVCFFCLLQAKGTEGASSPLPASASTQPSGSLDPKEIEILHDTVSDIKARELAPDLEAGAVEPASLQAVVFTVPTDHAPSSSSKQQAQWRLV
jgi:hypothetical protein